ncbi:MAG: dTMP kinase [Patescibacteria group bacterium]
MPNKMVAIEGIDGTGKSTVAKLLADLMGATLIKTPFGPMIGQRAYYDGEGIAPLVRYLFYLNCNVVASEEIERLLQSGPVVCDRYLISTLCFHKAMGVDVDIVDISKLPIVQPDHYFCLQAAEEVRLQRLYSRGYLSDTDEKIDLLREVDLMLPRYCGNIIDTTLLSADEVAQKIFNMIG